MLLVVVVVVVVILCVSIFAPLSRRLITGVASQAKWRQFLLLVALIPSLFGLWLVIASTCRTNKNGASFFVFTFPHFSLALFKFRFVTRRVAAHRHVLFQCFAFICLVSFPFFTISRAVARVVAFRLFKWELHLIFECFPPIAIEAENLLKKKTVGEDNEKHDVAVFFFIIYSFPFLFWSPPI